MLIIMVGTALGQTDHGYNLYGQLLGPSTGIGAGFDTRFKTGGVLGYSVGVGFTDISWDNGPDGLIAPYTDVDSRGVAIPLEVNAIMGSRASKFEIGLGLTAYFIRRHEWHSYTIFLPEETEYPDNYQRTTEYKNVFRPNIIGTINIGYRLQRSNGFFMKLGISLLVGDLKCSPIDGVAALPNICLGYTIPHF